MRDELELVEDCSYTSWFTVVYVVRNMGETAEEGEDGRKKRERERESEKERPSSRQVSFQCKIVR